MKWEKMNAYKLLVGKQKNKETPRKTKMEGDG
jgi:hypothetical protein